MELAKEQKIFLVDDDLFCLNIYEQHLKTLGFEDIHLFQNGSDCLTHLPEEPDIIFLDHKMNNLTGFEVLKKIKRFNPNIHVIMVSGQDNIQTALNALKFGAFDYIIKGEQEQEKMSNVIQRIFALNEVLHRNKPSFLERIFSFSK